MILEDFHEKYLSLYWHILHMITHFGISESNLRFTWSFSLRRRRLFNLNKTFACALCSHNHSDLVCVCVRIKIIPTKINTNTSQINTFQGLQTCTTKLYVRVRPNADIVFRYIALPVHQLCCVPVRIVFHISDLVEEKTTSKSYHSASNA